LNTFLPASPSQCPCVHQLAAPRQRVGSPVDLFGLVADHVRKRVFGKFAREMRFVPRPIPER
jgi:hypothetical protein